MAARIDSWQSMLKSIGSGGRGARFENWLPGVAFEPKNELRLPRASSGLGPHDEILWKGGASDFIVAEIRWPSDWVASSSRDCGRKMLPSSFAGDSSRI